MEDNKNLPNDTGNTDPTPAGNPNPAPAGKPDEKTKEELMAEIAALKLETQKAKADRDKALKSKGEIEKDLRARKTAQELEDDAKRLEKERIEEEMNELRAFKKNAEAKARYALQGMSEELATAAAQAEVEGDMEALMKIQKQHTEALLSSEKAKWIKERPVPNGGQGNGEGDDPFLKGFEMG